MKSQSRLLVAALALCATASANAVILGAVDPGEPGKSADSIVTGRLTAIPTAIEDHGGRHLDVTVDRILAGGAIQPGQIVHVAIPDGVGTDRLRSGSYGLFFLNRGAQGWTLSKGDESLGVASFRKPAHAVATTVEEGIANELVSALVSDDASLASSYGSADALPAHQRSMAGLVQREAVSELGTLPVAVTRPRLLEAAAAAPDDLSVQLACATALVSLRDASLLRTITPALLHVDPQQAGAVKDLARRYRLVDWDASATPTATALLESDDADVRSAAAWVLAKIKGRAASARPGDAVVQFPMQYKSPD